MGIGKITKSISDFLYPFSLTRQDDSFSIPRLSDMSYENGLTKPLTTSPKPCIITIIDTGKRTEQMKIKQIASNMTLLSLSDGSEVMFSYETPVAGRDSLFAFRTTEKYSVTTTKHINKYLRGLPVNFTTVVEEYSEKQISDMVTGQQTLLQDVLGK